MSKIWNLETEVRRMKRYDFICEFVRRMTSTAEKREAVHGYRLLRKSDGHGDYWWNYRIGKSPEMTTWKRADWIVDEIRRTPLGRLTAEADRLREEILTPAIDTSAVMEEAAHLLADIGATYEFPGYIEISDPMYTMRVSDANAVYGYDRYLTGADDRPIAKRTERHLPLTATARELARFVRESWYNTL